MLYPGNLILNLIILNTGKFNFFVLWSKVTLNNEDIYPVEFILCKKLRLIIKKGNYPHYHNHIILYYLWYKIKTWFSSNGIYKIFIADNITKG